MNPSNNLTIVGKTSDGMIGNELVPESSRDERWEPGKSPQFCLMERVREASARSRPARPQLFPRGGSGRMTTTRAIGARCFRPTTVANQTSDSELNNGATMTQFVARPYGRGRGRPVFRPGRGAVRFPTPGIERALNVQQPGNVVPAQLENDPYAWCKTIPCKYYADSVCILGTKCRFMHPSAPNQQNTSAINPIPAIARITLRDIVQRPDVEMDFSDADEERR